MTTQSNSSIARGFLEARDADGAQRFWRRHLDQVAKYMITDPATTVVEVLA